MNTSTSDFIIEPIGVDTSDISNTEICESSTSSDAETFSESDEDELDTSFFVLSDEDSPFLSLSKEVSATDRHTDPYDQPLYPGAASDLTVFMAYLLIFQYSLRHSLTKKALQELLQLVCVLLPAGSACPRSVHSLKNFFTEGFPDHKPSIKQYCTNCLKLLSTEQNCECNASTSDFITVPLGPQLKARLEGKCSFDLKLPRCGYIVYNTV